MNSIINKLVVFVLSAVAAMILLPIQSLIFPMLFTVAFGAFQEYSDHPSVKLWIFVSYSFVCFFLPECNYFLPILAYDLFFEAMQPVILICLPAILYRYSELRTEVLLIELSILTASILLKGTAIKSKSSQQKFLLQRDLLAEKSMNLERKLAAFTVRQDEEVELATLQERTRIAREIHDNVGHMLTSSILQVGALMATTKDPATQAGLVTVKDTLDQSMNVVRASVHDLRDTAIDLYGQLKKLTDGFSFRDEGVKPANPDRMESDRSIGTGMDEGELATSEIPPHTYACVAMLHYDISSSLALSVGAKYAIISIVKEALSNVAKHSGATEVTVGLYEHQKLLQLIISDNGCGLSAEKLRNLSYSEGMGIEGIKQRVASFSGHMNITAERGFRIFISFLKENLQ